jgi:preprotein translocase subunit SecD
MLNFSKIKIFAILATCAFAIIFALAIFVKSDYLPKQKLNLGLDLKGGSQLLLEANFDYYLNEKVKNLQNDLKNQFQENSLRALVEEFENTLIIEFFIKSDKDLLKKTIRNVDKYIEIDEEENNKLKIYFSNKQIEDFRKNLISQSIEIIRRRIDENGTKEPAIQAQGRQRILLQVPGVKNSSEIKAVLGKTAKMTFHFVSDESFKGEKRSSIINPDLKSIEGENGVIYFIEKEVALSGDLLVDANPTYFEGAPAVSFRFNQTGTKKFAKLTSQNIGRIFAIVLDNKVITAPRINTAINQGSGVITGNFTTKEASDLALLLRAGALPAPLKIIEERSIGPSLGSDSIKSGTYASMISLMLISLVMIVFYRKFGIVANIALFVNIAMILAILSLIEATLTLPGIAGIALTMGMSVDANVLIFERIKEEFRKKNSILLALENGFSQAFRTILDSNITTLIIALFLYIFGTGSIKGFAVTLSIGILSSMFCAILLTRLIIVIWVKKTKPKTLGII